MTPVQKKTEKAVARLIADALTHASEEDEFSDRICSACEAQGKIDTSTLDVSYLMSDPKIKKAFKKFVENVVGGFQYMEEEYGVNVQGTTGRYVPSDD